MLKLLKKEFALALHPASVLFVFFAAFVFIPNYPYEVMFFFSALSVFFICLTGRENKDISFTCALPVKKGDVAKARILFCVILQLMQVALCVALVFLKSALLPMPNAAGLDANIALPGVGLFILGIFDVIFFPMYFKNPVKVGVPFLIGSAAVFLCVACSVAACVAVPCIKETIDTADPLFLGPKCAVAVAGAAFYGAAVCLAARLSARRFEKVDL